MSDVTPLIPKDFSINVGDRYDQFGRSEIKVLANKSEIPTKFMIVVNDRPAGPFTKEDLAAIRDCLVNDVEFKRI